MQFLFVYVREAHPTDGWAMPNSKLKDPRELDGRKSHAGQCVGELQFDFPAVGHLRSVRRHLDEGFAQLLRRLEPGEAKKHFRSAGADLRAIGELEQFAEFKGPLIKLAKYVERCTARTKELERIVSDRSNPMETVAAGSVMLKPGQDHKQVVVPGNRAR